MRLSHRSSRVGSRAHSRHRSSVVSISTRPIRGFSKNLRSLATRSYLLSRYSPGRVLEKNLTKRYFILMLIILLILGVISTMTSYFYLYNATERQTFDKITKEIEKRLEDEKNELMKKYDFLLRRIDTCNGILDSKVTTSEWTEAENTFSNLKPSASFFEVIQKKLKQEVNSLNYQFLKPVIEANELAEAKYSKYQLIDNHALELKINNLLQNKYESSVPSSNRKKLQCVLKKNIKLNEKDSQELEMLRYEAVIWSLLTSVFSFKCDSYLSCNDALESYMSDVINYIKVEVRKKLKYTYVNIIPRGFIYIQVNNHKPPLPSLNNIEWLDVTHALPFNYSFEHRKLRPSSLQLSFWMTNYNYSKLSIIL